MNYNILLIIGVLIIISIFLVIIKKNIDPLKENVDYLSKKTNILKNNMDQLSPLLDGNTNIQQIANQSSTKLINAKQYLNPKDWALLGPGSYDGFGGDNSQFNYAFVKTIVPPIFNSNITSSKISQFAWYYNYEAAEGFGGIVYGLRYSTDDYTKLIGDNKDILNTWGDWHYFQGIIPSGKIPDVFKDLFK